MFHGKRWHLICYDISDKRRLQKIQRRVAKQALALQKSVYVLNANQSELNEILNAIESMMDASRDDLRSYPVPHPSQMWFGGAMVDVMRITGLANTSANIVKPDSWLRRLLFGKGGAA